MKKTQAKDLLNLALETGEMLLRYGAETYRVEETMNLMCLKRGMLRADSFATPTGLFFTVEDDSRSYTKVRRVKRQDIDLHRIEEINSFARAFSSSEMSVEDGYAQLARITALKPFPNWLEVMAGGVTCAFFAVLLGGSVYDLPLGFITGALLRLYLVFIKRFRFGFFLDLLTGSFLLTLFIYLTAPFFMKTNSNALVIGMIMQMVPGVAITNSIRDTLTGDFLSGVSRSNEAIFIALAIAFGVGFALWILPFIGGVLWAF